MNAIDTSLGTQVSYGEFSLSLPLQSSERVFLLLQKDASELGKKHINFLSRRVQLITQILSCPDFCLEQFSRALDARFFDSPCNDALYELVSKKPAHNGKQTLHS